jgi:hypothetical protein
MSQDGHCCGSPRWEGGGEDETRSPDIAPIVLVVLYFTPDSPLGV